MNNPLLILLEKTDFNGFLEACKNENLDPLTVRLDGINMFTAIIVCNAKSAEKISIMEKALQVFPDKQIMHALLNEKMSVTLDPRKSPEEVLAIPFILSHLYISECETLLEGLIKLGVEIPATTREEIKNVLLENFGCSKIRIERFFEDLGK
mgnify:CR=1 FL=1